MALSANSIVLFVGGVILGVLISLSVINRFKQPAPVFQPAPVLKSKTVTETKPSSSSVSDATSNSDTSTASNALDQFLAASRQKRSQTNKYSLWESAASSASSAPQIPPPLPPPPPLAPLPANEGRKKAPVRWAPGMYKQEYYSNSPFPFEAATCDLPTLMLPSNL